MRIFFLLLATFFTLALKAEPTILVSIPPQKYLVERIAKGTVNIEVIVPPGASPHSYEPTPYQAVKIQEGDIWFRMGEGFETKLIALLKKTKVVDQRDGIPLLPASCTCHDPNACDVHFWLSPKLLKKMAIQIEETLSEAYPESRDFYKENLTTLLFDIDRLDQEVYRLLSPMKHKVILVSHPAFAYLCAEYEITQLAIEMEGKEPSPKYLSQLYLRAKHEHVQTVFLQQQYNVKGGKKLAHDLHAKVIFLDPYSENVIENIKKIAEAFSHS